MQSKPPLFEVRSRQADFSQEPSIDVINQQFQ